MTDIMAYISCLASSGFVLGYCNFSATLHSFTVMSGSWLCYVECDKKNFIK